MVLSDILIENFGPYYGKQRLDFGRKRPIVVVHGDNMRGKTSVLNAIRWALYGAVHDRLGFGMTLLQLVNLDAQAEGQSAMSVQLDFEVDGTQYSLTRAVQPKGAANKPVKDSDFEEKLFLRRGGAYLSPDESQAEINRILPERISRFFLFDGELLSRYESLVSRAETQSTAIKESIEHILGVPSLINGMVDLKLNLKDAAKRQRRLAKEDDNVREFAAEASEIEAAMDALEVDMDGLNQRQRQYRGRQSELDTQLQSTAGIELDARRLSELKEQISKYEQQQVDLEVQKRKLLAEAWRDIIQPRIQSRLTQLEAERDGQFEALKGALTTRSRIEELELLSSSGECPTCGSPSNKGTKARTESGIKALRETLGRDGYDEQKWIDAQSSIRHLRGVMGAGVIGTIAEIERQLSSVKMNRVDLEVRVEELGERIGRYDYSEVIANRREYESVTSELGAIEAAIREKQARLAEGQAKAAQLRSKIGGVSGPEMERLNLEVRIYEDMILLFEGAVARLRDELRVAVERDASAIFMELTTDKSYTGLQINESYGLTILDSAKREVPVRSAGAEQVVALSLIGALNRNAVRRGPMVMDTPFGRLDPSHRENILKFIPTMASQVTLLVHGGEIDRARDLGPIMDQIEREYTIRFASSRRSQIVQIRGSHNE